MISRFYLINNNILGFFTITCINNMGVFIIIEISIAIVNEDNSILVVDGNYDGENNIFEEFISMPDRNQRAIPYSVWYEKYEFCNPPQ